MARVAETRERGLGCESRGSYYLGAPLDRCQGKTKLECAWRIRQRPSARVRTNVAIADSDMDWSDEVQR